MKKLTVFLMGILISSAVIMGLTACADVHRHTYSTEWSSDATAHWQSAICGHDGEQQGTAQHIFAEGKVTKEATCTEAGSKKFECTVCGYINTIAISMTEHLYEAWTIESAATCLADGSKKRVCSECGKVENDKIPVAKHNYGDWETIRESTCTAEGIRERVCSVCGDRETETIARSSHVTGEWSHDELAHWQKCVNCEETFHQKSHEFQNRTCTVCGYIAEYSLGLKYKISEDGKSYTVAGIGTATDTDLIIPAVYLGLPVTNIGFNAFFGCTFKSIVIPNRVTIIENNAFRNCKNLKSVVIADSVTTIEQEAFLNCGALTDLTIGSGMVRIAYNAFRGCDKLIETEGGVSYVDTWVIGCDESVKQIGLRENTKGFADYAFRDCDMIGIQIPDSVVSIGESSFEWCLSLENITLPAGLKYIGDFAFRGCNKVKILTIPSKVMSIGTGVFSMCSNLTSIAVEINNNVYHSDKNCLIETMSKTLIAGCKVSEIPEDGSVTILQDYAFEGSGLNHVTIPQSIIEIGSRVFSSNNIESITVALGNSIYHSEANCIIETERKMLIAGCKNSIIPADGSVTSIASNAFYDCPDITTIVIPATVTTIGERSFYNCNFLTDLVISEGVVQIEDSAFYSCGRLTNLTIPSSVRSVGANAFQNCYGLKNISISEGVNSIKFGAFSDCRSLESVILPYTLTNISDRMFQNCEKLISIEISSNLASIGWNAFVGCRELESIVFDGTAEEWLALEENVDWDNLTGEFLVHCSDGVLSKTEAGE